MISDAVFRQALTQCFGNGSVPKRILVALSGGVDSLGLTFLLSRYRRIYDRDVEVSAITIDHGYREETGEEIEQIGQIVGEWGVKHIVRRLRYEKEVRSINNFEEVARTKRYEVMRDTCYREGYDNLFLAHSLDDQLETFIMRLMGNSSMFGLVGSQESGVLPVKPLGPSQHFPVVRTIRPLLSFTKEEIIATCKRHNVRWFEDYTNQDIGLTKRNLYRYLLSSDASNLSKRKVSYLMSGACIRIPVSELRNDVCLFVDEMEKRIRGQIDNLKAAQLYNLDERYGTLHLRVPIEKLGLHREMFLSRLLYYVLYPLSSVKHYHWSYAKLERSVVPRLLSSSLSNPVTEHKATCLNLSIAASYDQDAKLLNFSFSRQPLMRHEPSSIGFDATIDTNFSPWYLYDRRFWMRFRSTSGPQKINVAPYSNQNLDAVDPDRRLNYKTLNGVPLVTSSHGLTSLPTLSIDSDNTIKTEWCLKDNLYERRTVCSTIYH